MGNKEEAQPTREKHWSEIDDTEKIERMRTVVKTQGEALANIRNQLWDLQEHSHAEGKLVISLNSQQRITERAFTPLGKKDDVYF